MFERAFKEVLSNLTPDQLLIDKLWKEINSNYRSSHRYYHTVTHLDHLIAELYPVKDQIEDWETVTLSVAYHDIVYNPLKNDNEEKSAAMATDRLSQLNVSKDQKEKCRQQILSTRTHAVSDKPDTNYLTDADLAILGSDPESYSEYSRKVRKEYKYFPDLVYNPGRKKVLMRFLEMSNIFKTTYFQNKYEVQARLNMASELKSLL